VSSRRLAEYRSARHVPDEALSWNLYGVGLDRFGRAGAPERSPVPEPAPHELLVRVDAVSLCFSDVKVCRLGNEHPKLRGRDLAAHPTRLGHEVALTVAKAGTALRDRFEVGERLALQPDIYRDGASIAYGYVLPGGLTQFQVLSPEIVGPGTDYVMPVSDAVGYAETALSEPWACVEAAYTQRRRLEPRPGGTLWILGREGDDARYAVPESLQQAARIVATDVPAPFLEALRSAFGDRVTVKDKAADYGRLVQELTGGAGFDDIVMLDPRKAGRVAAALSALARRGTLNLVMRGSLDGRVAVDVGRVHYDMLAIVGARGTDIGAAYGAARNRCELRRGGTLVVVGAGGPMGQMHLQRAIELPDGPATIIASEASATRLESIVTRFRALADRHRRRLLVVDAGAQGEDSLESIVRRETGGEGADDVVVCAPSASAIEDAAALMRADGMLVIFAGVPHGTTVHLDLGAVARSGAQYTGTSGSTPSDQRVILRRASEGQLSMNRSVAAIGGMDAAREGLRAVMETRFAGKVVLFPQLDRLPLTPLSDLAETHPAVAEALEPGGVWSQQAESRLIEELWSP
jgi:threonine dehydrogenase-like Zn-dependent dehydrogenase